MKTGGTNRRLWLTAALGGAAVALSAPTRLMAETAEKVTVQLHHGRVVGLETPVDHFVVGTPNVLDVTRVAPEAIELWGKEVGRSLVLVWTARARFVFLVTVEPEPQEPRPKSRPALEEPHGGPDASLYSYRGALSMDGTTSLEPRRHAHRVSAYQPVGAGTLYAYADASRDLGGPGNSLPELDSALIRYRDPLWTIQGGDISTRVWSFVEASNAVRGLAAAYHDPKLELGAYGGFEPSGLPGAFIELDQPVRLGAFSEFELAPNAALAIDAMRRQRFPTPRGKQTITIVAPSARWDPSTSLALRAQGGVSDFGGALRAEANYRVPALQAGGSYWTRGTGYLDRGSPRIDLASANVLVNLSRAYSLGATASRTVQGAHAFAPESRKVAIDSEMIQLSAPLAPIFDHGSVAITRSHAGYPASVAGQPTKDDRNDVQLFLDRELGRYLGRLALRGTGMQLERRADTRVRASAANVEVYWYPPSSGSVLYDFGLAYGTGLTRGAVGVKTDRYALRQDLGINVAGVYASLRLEASREVTDVRSGPGAATDDVTRDFLNGALRLIYRPTQAHELLAEGYLNNQLSASNKGAAAALGTVDVPTRMAVFLSYAFYFGDAVTAPSLLDTLRSETIRVESFLDANENGTRDEGEPAQGNLSVVVDDGEKVHTDDDGVALFSGVGVGGHTVVVDVNGAGAGHNGLRFTTASSRRVNLEEGETAVVSVGVSDRGRIYGAVYNDLDLDGEQQPGEAGVPGVVVTLSSGGRALQRTPAGIAGDFAFELLAPGPYQLAIAAGDVPPDYESARTEIETTVESGQLSRGSFALVAHRSIEGVVFVDKNRNGVFDPGERTLTGAEVHWDGRSVKSNGGGKYLIRRLPAGRLDIWVDPVSLPPGHEPVGRVPVILPANPTSIRLDLPVRPAGSVSDWPMPVPQKIG